MAEQNILDGNAAAVTEALASIADGETLVALKEQEAAGKNRAGVLKAIDAAILAVSGPAITKEPEGAPVPTMIQLTCPFGYMDDENQHHFWQAGQIITDPAEIADLLTHGAEHIDISE